jgi:hypothetical protein
MKFNNDIEKINFDKNNLIEMGSKIIFGKYLLGIVLINSS